MIRWNTSMNTGVRQIDLQHLELVDMINEMETLHETGQSSIALDEILPRLISYAMFHFGEEEILLAQVAEGTPFADHHLKQHRSFSTEIDKLLVDRANVPDDEQAGRLISYLGDWLLRHISGTDQILARMLLGKVIPVALVERSNL